MARRPGLAVPAVTGLQALMLAAGCPAPRGRHAAAAFVPPAAARSRSARCQRRRAPRGSSRRCSPRRAAAGSRRHRLRPFGRRVRVGAWVAVARWPRSGDTSNLDACGPPERDDFRSFNHRLHRQLCVRLASGSGTLPSRPSPDRRLGGMMPSPVRRLCGARWHASSWRFDDSGLEIIGPVTSIEVNTECVGECRIGGVPPVVKTLRLPRNALLLGP